MSTMHSSPDVDTSTEKKKPEVILFYNSTKGGVDTMDQMLRCYSIKRMTQRWPMVIFYNMVDVSAMNAFIVWTSIHPSTSANKGNERRKFLITLGKELLNQPQSSVEETSSGVELQWKSLQKNEGATCVKE